MWFSLKSDNIPVKVKSELWSKRRRISERIPFLFLSHPFHMSFSPRILGAVFLRACRGLSWWRTWRTDRCRWIGRPKAAVNENILSEVGNTFSWTSGGYFPHSPQCPRMIESKIVETQYMCLEASPPPPTNPTTSTMAGITSWRACFPPQEIEEDIV